MTSLPPNVRDDYRTDLFGTYTDYILIGIGWYPPIETLISWIGVIVIAILMLISGIIFFPFFILGYIVKRSRPYTYGFHGG